MADSNKNFFTGLFNRRKEIQKGVEVKDLHNLAQSMGYDLAVTKEGQYVPIPQNTNSEEVNSFQARWNEVAANASDLVNNRPMRLSEYNKMDSSGGESSIVLDITADEVANITDYTDSSLTIEVSDKTLEKKVFEVLSNNGILDNVRSDIRNMCKFGDFSYIFVQPNYDSLVDFDEEDAKGGSKLKVPFQPKDLNIVYTPTNYYELESNSSKIFKLKLDDLSNSYFGLKDFKKTDYYPWEYSLFSIKSRDTFPYGMSVLEKMRLPWQKLAILEELLAITRANRLDKVAITVPGLKGDPTSVLNRLSQLKNSIRNIILGFNGTGGRISRNQDTGMTDYLWLPEGFDAKKLSTSIEVSTIEDVEYFREAVINASRLPKGFFLAGESGGQQRPMSLRQQDIKFARSLIPVSEAYASGLQKLVTLIVFYLGGDISKVKINVGFKKSPYIAEELINTYKGVYDIIQNYKEIKSGFSEVKEITDVDVMRIMDLVGAPHELLFPEKESKKSKINDSKVTNDLPPNLLEACLL